MGMATKEKRTMNGKPGMYRGDWDYIRAMLAYLACLALVLGVLWLAIDVIGPAFYAQLEKLI